VRHPLYVSEFVAGFGVMLLYQQPWSALVYSIGAALQFGRIHFEELRLGSTISTVSSLRATHGKTITFNLLARFAMPERQPSRSGRPMFDGKGQHGLEHAINVVLNRPMIEDCCTNGGMTLNRGN